MAQSADLLAQIDALPEELREAVVSDRQLTMIHHPLLVEYITTSSISELTGRLESKRRAVREAQQAGNWCRVLALHEKPYRLNALLEFAGEMPDRDYWRALAFAWISTEFPSARQEEWEEAFTAPRATSSEMMDAEEQAIFDTFPSLLTVYRGIDNESALHGLAWTLDRAVAERFARRFKGADRRALVATARLDSRGALAYFNGRNEQEVVVLPSMLRDVKMGSCEHQTTGRVFNR